MSNIRSNVGNSSPVGGVWDLPRDHTPTPPPQAANPAPAPEEGGEKRSRESTASADAAQTARPPEKRQNIIKPEKRQNIINPANAQQLRAMLPQNQSRTPLPAARPSTSAAHEGVAAALNQARPAARSDEEARVINKNFIENAPEKLILKSHKLPLLHLGKWLYSNGHGTLQDVVDKANSTDPDDNEHFKAWLALPAAKNPYKGNGAAAVIALLKSYRKPLPINENIIQNAPEKLQSIHIKMLRHLGKWLHSNGHGTLKDVVDKADSTDPNDNEHVKAWLALPADANPYTGNGAAAAVTALLKSYGKPLPINESIIQNVRKKLKPHHITMLKHLGQWMHRTGRGTLQKIIDNSGIGGAYGTQDVKDWLDLPAEENPFGADAARKGVGGAGAAGVTALLEAYGKPA